MPTYKDAALEVRHAARKLGLDLMAEGHDAPAATMFRLASSPSLQTALPRRAKHRVTLAAYLRSSAPETQGVADVFGALLSQVEASL